MRQYAIFRVIYLMRQYAILELCTTKWDSMQYLELCTNKWDSMQYLELCT